ncbi:helix-turn-helix domain-containing protein [Paenibacillus sp. CAU 1782]
MHVPASWTPIEDIVFRLRSMDYCRLEAGECRSSPGRDTMRLLLVAAGSGIIESGERRQLAGRGSWFLWMAGAPLGIAAHEGEGLACYDIAFHLLRDSSRDVEQVEVSDSVAVEGEVPFYCGEAVESEWMPMVDKARRLYLVRDASDGLDGFRGQMVFQELMYEFLQHVSLQRNDKAEEAIWSVVRYMERHFQNTLTRDRLAKMSGLNKEYFSKLFKKVTGKTPKAYLTDIRINNAKRELLRGHIAISDIAAHVGFEEGYYFSRKFKQTVGMAPTEYAARQKNKVACLFFPYIDHLLALGITPYAAMIPRSHPLARLVASSITLGEDETEFSSRAAETLAVAEPEMILCSNYINPQQEDMLSRIAPTVPVVWNQDWRPALSEIAALLGRQREAKSALAAYEQRCSEAGASLRRKLGEQTVALVRFHHKEIRLYGGPARGYTGPVLYGELGLNAPDFIKDGLWDVGTAGISLDELAQLDADHLLLVTDPDAESHANNVLNAPQWNKLRAVQSGNVHQAGYFVWMSCGITMNNLKVDELVAFLG